MVWLWLSFPLLLLGAAVALWQATRRIDSERQDLEAQVAALRATGPDPARR
jgi:hypothetical protein